MAKQLTGFIEGTIDGICFYKMEGKYYARTKSCLTGKRFWQDKSFEGSRKSCSRFAAGNRIASEIYRKIQPEKRRREMYQQLRTKAIALLKNETTIAETIRLLTSEIFVFFSAEEKTQRLASETQVVKNNSACFRLCRYAQKKRLVKAAFYVHFVQHHQGVGAVAVLLNVNTPAASSDQAQYKQHKENKEQDLGYTCRTSGDSTKAKYGCYNSYYQKNNCPT